MGNCWRSKTTKLLLLDSLLQEDISDSLDQVQDVSTLATWSSRWATAGARRLRAMAQAKVWEEPPLVWVSAKTWERAPSSCPGCPEARLTSPTSTGGRP